MIYMIKLQIERISMLEVKLYDLGYCDEKDYTRVVCLCKYHNKYVFYYNTKRNG